ncbi:FecR domain-containing protein [Flavobacterium sp.]|uniref:FecR family protein n=1 Tax=Flavobacterium sp. TaxID=239 RepID=UPI00286C8385|nr:FecR domain-containing protein [Flavobacterium sp.]
MKTTSENNANERFLSDWIAGKITDDQLKTMVSEFDFKAYQKLKFSLQAIQVSEADMQKNFAAIQEKIAIKQHRKKSKVRPIFAYAAIAASLVLFFGLYHLLAFSNTFQTDYGKSATLVLSDHSEVTLNAKSKMRFPSLFQYNRTLKLEGEAYFKVAKGSTFTVETAQGKVQVLGTQFNVNVSQDCFEVHCFEGKVKVTTPTTTHILTHGKSVRIYRNNAETWDDETHQKPTWINGESSFSNAPLQTVIAQFQNQYHYQVEFPKTLSTVRFTGSFTHHDFNTALQSICLPMHLNYSKTDSETIRISE